MSCLHGHAWVLGTCGRCGLPKPGTAITVNERIASAAALLGLRVGTLVDCLVSNGLAIVTQAQERELHDLREQLITVRSERDLMEMQKGAITRRLVEYEEKEDAIGRIKAECDEFEAADGAHQGLSPRVTIQRIADIARAATGEAEES